MHLGESARQREPDAQPALPAIARAFSPREHLEHLGQHLGRDAHARVADGNRRRIALVPDADHDIAAIIRVLGRVAEQIGENLRQAHGVALDPQRFVRLRHAQPVAAGANRRLRRLDRIAHDLGHAQTLLAQRECAAADARNFEQVVNQSYQVIDLSLHHLVDRRRRGVAIARETQQMQRVAQRRERVAQFVR